MQLLLIFSFLICGAILISSDDIVIVDNCDEDWVNNDGYCYFIVDDKLATQDEATDDCTTRKAALITLETTDEVTFMVGDLSSLTASDGWWTKLTRVDDQWQWDDSWQADSTVLQWNIEPDNANGQENCVAVNEQATFTDEDCTKKYGFICQLQVATCPLGWVDYNDVCYWISDTFNVTQLMTWQMAIQFCPTLVQNAQLISPKNQDAMEFLTNSLPEVAQTTLPWWISLNRKATQWFWGTQSPADTPSMAMIKWAREPNNMNGGESCVMMFANGKLADKACDRVANWICKKPDSSVPNTPYDGKFGCSSNWMRAGRKCYYFENHFTDTPDAARQKCQKSGGDLLRIDTEDERYWIDLMCRFYNTGFLTQLRATTIAKNDWQYADGSTPKDGIVQWNKEPNDYSGVEDCISITPKLTWNDRSCRNHLGYICEAVASGGGCPTNWVNNAGSCYFFGPPTTNVSLTMNFRIAQTTCKRTAEPLVGSLLVLNTDAELTFVNQQLLSRKSLGLAHWIGLNDFNGEGIYTWLNSPNVPVDMDAFPWDQAPSCTDCNPVCASINLGGYFNDFDCSVKWTYACEKYATGVSGTGHLRGGYITVTALTILSGFTYFKRL